MDIKDILKKLSETDAPTGYETPATDVCAKLLKPFCDEIFIDPVGSLIAKRRGHKEDAETVLLKAHIDEIGFIITGIEKDKNDIPTGFLRFQTLGGVSPGLMPASIIKILTETPVYGVIDVVPPHVQSEGESDKLLPIDSLRIDVGGPEAAASIPVGTPAVFAAPSISLGENIFAGKAMDDRVCFAAVLLALEKLRDTELDINVVIAATSQEEAGMRGAYSASYYAHPKYAIIADVGFAEQPDINKPETVSKLGKGGIITFHANADRSLTKKLIETAKNNDIPLSVTAEGGGNSGTDAFAVQVAQEGVITAIVGVPIKYMHSPCETLDVRDVESLAELIAVSLKSGVFNA